MKTKMSFLKTSGTIGTAIAIITLFSTHTFSFSQGCHGMSSSSSGKDNTAKADKATSTVDTNSGGTVTYYTCPMHPEVINNKPVNCPKCGMTLVQKTSTIEKSQQLKDTVIYTCSMHPEVQSDQPGNCPKCGMALVKKSDTSGMKMKCGMMGGMSMAENKEQNNSAPGDSTKKDKIIYTCPMHAEVQLAQAGNCTKCGMTLEKKTVQPSESKTEKKETAKVYGCCPMCPDVKSDKPGKCPKCGMELIEKK